MEKVEEKKSERVDQTTEVLTLAAEDRNQALMRYDIKLSFIRNHNTSELELVRTDEITEDDRLANTEKVHALIDVNDEAVTELVANTLDELTNKIEELGYAPLSCSFNSRTTNPKKIILDGMMQDFASCLMRN